MHFRAAVVVTILPTLLLTGCGQGEYESRMDGALAKAASRGGGGGGGGGTAGLSPDYFSVTSPDKKKIGIKFKLPAQFVGKEIPSVSIKESGAIIPGIVGDFPICTLQATFVDDTGKQVAATCYMFDVFKTAFTRKALEEWIQAESLKLDPQAAFKALGNSGQPPRSVLQLNSNFDFLVDSTKENRAGQLLIHSFETDLSTVFVCWVIENQSQQKAKLADVISKSMDTAVLEPPEITAPMK
jgi:hypothetical protein